MEIKDYIVLTRGEDNGLLTSLRLMLDVTITHDHYGRTTQYTSGALTYKISSNDSPHPDGDLKNEDRKKIRHYRQLYVDKIDPIIFIPSVVNTSCHSVMTLTGELPEESDQFRFLHTV